METQEESVPLINNAGNDIVEEQEGSVPLLTGAQNEDNANQNQYEYQGYEPVHPADFPFEEDNRVTSRDESNTTLHPNLLRDNAGISKPVMVFSVVFFLAFIALFVWQILIARCLVTDLCETIDQSSDSDYLFRTFQFRIPSALLWLGLTCGTLGLLVSSIFAVFVLRKKVGTARMVAIATVVRKGSASFLAQQNLAILTPVFILSIVVGLTINWKTGGAFALGASICITTTEAGISISTRGNVRASAAAHVGLKEAVKIAFRSGAIAGVSILSIALIGICSAYLMFADVRSLAGFIAGASTTSLFLRISGCVFTRATSKSAALVHTQPNMNANPSFRSNKKVATYVGSGVGTVFGIGPDLFESFVAAVIATAILGSTLPFFYRDSYAMCVYNHLEIDQFCGPFGYPEQLSYAIYICRQNNFYLSYPQLTTWASNTAFIAAPFVLGAAGLLVALVCTVYVRVTAQNHQTSSDNRKVIEKIRFSIRLNMLLGSFLLVLSSAAIFFGMFGPISFFQGAVGLSAEENLSRMELQKDLNNTCLSKSLNVTDTSAINPFPIPQGGQYISDRYRPIDNVGLQIGPANTTDQRLFGCAVLGIVLGVFMTGFCSVYFTAETFGPTQRVAKAARFGTVSTVLQGLGNGFLGSFPPTIFLLTGIAGSYALYGSYGVGVMAVAFLSGTGVAATGSVLGSIADNARGIARMASFTKRARRETTALDSIGAAVSISATEFANGGAFLAAVTLLLVAIQTSGMFPSPTEIVGSQEVPPTRQVWRTDGIPLWNIYVITGILVGTTQPFIVAGLLLLAVRSAALAMIVETKNQTGQDSTRYARFIGVVTRACLIESVLPVLAIFMTPLIVGFGFGQRAVLAMLVASLGTGFVLGTSVTSAAGSWEGAERIVAGRGGVSGRGSERHWSTLYAREFGSPLRECVAPGMQSMMKTGASITLVLIPLMQRDNTKGWIGGIILGVLVVLVVAFAVWKRMRHIQHIETNNANRGTVTAPPKRVSPFFEETVKVDPRVAAPGSQMAEAFGPIGNPGVPVKLDALPGLSDRSQADLGNLEYLQGQSAIADGDGYVLRDDARENQI